MSRLRSLRVATAAALLAGLLSVPLLLPTPAGGAEPAPWPCDLVSTRVIRPAVLNLGAEARVTMTLAGACRPVTRPLHVVLLLDASAGMKPPELVELQDALVDAVLGVDLPQHPWLSLGVVSFSDHAQVLRGLTSGPEQVIAGIRNVVATDVAGTADGLRDALREALRMLPAARPGRTAEEVRTGPREVILVASNGVEAPACDRVRDEAADAHARGVLVMTACVGANCGRTCLAEAPSVLAGRGKFEFRSWSSWKFLPPVLADLVATTGPYFAPIERVTVVDQLHENLLYEGGGDPSAGDPSRLTWSFAPWDVAPLLRSYRVRAMGVGRYPVSRQVTATLHFNDIFWPGLRRTVALDNPVLEVPTAIPTVATPVATTPPPPATRVSPTATPTASATPDPGTARPPERVFLPYLARAACPGAARQLDLMLLLDVSGSMGSPVPGFANRLQLARHLAKQVVESLPPDAQVGLLQYSGTVEILAALGPCCGPTRDALDRVGWGNGTRLDLAIEQAVDQLSGPRARPEARPAMVFFTDGDVNQTTEPALAAALARAGERGVTGYAVGIGDIQDLVLLQRLAGDPARVVVTGRDGVVAARWPRGAPPGCD